MVKGGLPQMFSKLMLSSTCLALVRAESLIQVQATGVHKPQAMLIRIHSILATHVKFPTFDK